jgi:hypothetical protein
VRTHSKAPGHTLQIVDVAEGLREAQIDEVDAVTVLAGADEEVGRLDVSVDIMSVVHKLQVRDLGVTRSARQSRQKL